MKDIPLKNLTLFILCYIPLMASTPLESAISKTKNLSIYKSPFLNSNIISYKSNKETFVIEYCNKYSWCKLKNEKGFVKKNHISILNKTKINKGNINRNTPKSTYNNIQESSQYKTALLEFRKKNYEKSFLLFAHLSSLYPNNEYINFYYGRSAFELKNYEYAFSSFDRILINTPNNARVRAEFARTLMMMKSYKEAKKEFQKVLLLPIPIAVRTNIEKFIIAIDSKQKKYILNKVAIFGIGWDDNIDNNTHINTTAYGSLDLTNDTTKKHDTHFSTILVGNLIIPNKENKKISWETTAITFIQEQSRYKDNNILLLSLSSGVGYTTKLYKNLTSLTYDYIWLGGDKTLYLYGITNSIKSKINVVDLIKFDIKLKKKKFVEEENYDKSSQIKEFTFSYDKTLANKKDKISLSSSYIEERKRQGIRTDVNKNTSKYKISYKKNFFTTYDISLGFQQEFNKYKEFSANLPTRDDTKYTHTTKISHKLSKKKSINIEYKHIQNNSNINAYTYKKQSVNLNYTLIF